MEEEELNVDTNNKAKSYDSKFKTEPENLVSFNKWFKQNNDTVMQPFNLSSNMDNLQGWENPLTFQGGNNITDINDPLKEVRAINQSGWAKAAKIAPRVSAKILSEIVKLPGYIGGLVGGTYGEISDAITDKNEYSFTEQAFNNGWLKTVEQMNQEVNKELLPVYVKKSVEKGNLWDNISSVDFWATEGTDGIGFMASMMVPGAVLKALGLGAKMARGAEATLALANKGTQYQKLMAGARKAAELGLNAKNFDVFNATVANTYLESAAEAGMAMDSFEKQNKEEFINTQIALGKTYEEAQQEFNTQKALLGRNLFVSNVALLTIPNALQASMMFGKQASKFMTSYGFKDSLKAAGKRVVKNTISEGLIEEAGQTTVEKYFSEKAKENNLKGDGFLSFEDFDPTGLKEAYLNTIASTDGQKAIFLGAVLGSTMSVYQGRNEDIQNKKISDQVSSLTSRYDKTLQALLDTNGNVSYDENNDKKVNIKEVINKFKTIDELSHRFKEYDDALESGNEELLEKARNKTIQDVILPFVKQGEIGLEGLSKYYDNMLESEEVKNSEDFDIIKARKEEVLNTAKNVSKKYDFYTDFINKRFQIPIKAETKEQQEILNQTKALYFDKLASSYALAEMDKEQVSNKLKELNKELQTLDEIHNLNEVTTDELIFDYKHNTDTKESFTNKKKEKFSETNKEYKELFDYKNRLEQKLKETNLEISEQFFNSEKVQKDFISKEEDKIDNDTFNQPQETEEDELDKQLEKNEITEISQTIQNTINESIDEEGDSTLTVEELQQFINEQDIPQEQKDALILLNEDQINTLPTQEQLEEKSEVKRLELEGVSENDLKDAETSGNLIVDNNDYLKSDIINNDGIDELNDKGHKLMSLNKLFKPVFDKLKQFVNYEKTPRNKLNDNVEFSLGDFIDATDNTVKEKFNKLKSGNKLSKDEIALLEKYLPIKVILSNGNESGFTYLQTGKSQNSEYQDIFIKESLPLRKAIVQALIKHNGDFSKFKGVVQGQGKGKLNLSDNTNNNILKLSVFNGMTKEQKIEYIQNNSYYVSHERQLKSLKTGEVTFEDFSNTIKTLYSGDVFLVVTRPNGEKVPIKLNNKRLSEDKALATVKLLALLSKIKKGLEKNDILTNSDFVKLLKNTVGEDTVNQFKKEIKLLNKTDKSESSVKLEQLITNIVNFQSNHPVTKMFMGNNGDLVLGTLIQKVNEDLQDEGLITFENNLSSIGFTGFNNNNISTLLNNNLSEQEQARLNHLVRFIMYKKTNIQDNFENKDYVDYVFDLSNTSDESGDALVSTNVEINKDMFEGYSNIFLENNVVDKEEPIKLDNENKFLDKSDVQNKTYPEPELTNAFGTNPVFENNSENIRNSEKNFVSLQDDTVEVLDKGFNSEKLTQEQKSLFNKKAIEILGKEAIQTISQLKGSKSVNDVFEALKNKLIEKGYDYNETLKTVCKT